MTLLIYFKLSLIILLGVAVVCDLRENRIPNSIVLLILVLGVTSSAYVQGSDTVLMSLAGVVTGICLFLPFYVFGGMGAGDVKLMGAVGAFLGPATTVFAVGLTLITGAILAIAVLVYFTTQKNRSPSYNTVEIAQSNSSDALGGPDLQSGSSHLLKKRFPYAIAIAFGSTIALFI